MAFEHFDCLPYFLSKGDFQSEETGDIFHCQNRYSKSLSSAENLNFPPKTVYKLFKFSAQDSGLEYLFCQQKNPSVSSDLKPPFVVECRMLAPHTAQQPAEKQGGQSLPLNAIRKIPLCIYFNCKIKKQKTKKQKTLRQCN